MADNVFYNQPGSGTVIGVDVCTVNGVAGVGVQLTKAGFGANESFTYVTGSVGMPTNLVQYLGAAVGATNAQHVQPGTGANFANETGGNLATIAGRTPALGQALAAASVPVVLTTIQIAALMPPAAITGFALDATLSTLSGKVTACNTGAVVLAAGSAVIGHAIIDSGTVTANAGTNLNTSALALDATLTGGTQKAQPIAGTSGGWTPSHALMAATTNATSVKASPGQVGGIVLANANTSSARFFRLYDTASSPSPGTTAIKLLIVVPAASSASQPTVVTLNNTAGIAFTSGIAYAVTGAMPDNDTTALATAGDMSVDLLTK